MAFTVDISIAYNLGCISNMLKGATSNSMSALASLDGAGGDMKEEMVRVLQLYLECYPLSLAANTEYLTVQLDSLIHRLVTLLKEGMYWFSLHSPTDCPTPPPSYPPSAPCTTVRLSPRVWTC